MIYMVAGIYQVIGRNMLATQLFNAVLGAAIAPVVYLSSWEVFKNIRVARISAYAVAFMPSLVLWSAQGLKDGPIMFMLAVSILSTLKLREKFSVKWLMILICASLGVLAFRFYVFYMLVIAISGALFIGSRTPNALSLARQFALLIVLALTMTVFGSIMGARSNFERYGSLKTLSLAKTDAANSANSGYAKNSDVSTPAGAVSAIPQGLVYLLFAPFPWELGSARQAITVPEMIVWWTTFPVLIVGLWFSIRYRFRKILPILIFTIMLTLAYSVFQGNVGNAYRQRAQLLIFYFIFTAAGCVQFLEAAEPRRVTASYLLNGRRPKGTIRVRQSNLQQLSPPRHR
jgi:4-amino-4-deoxy-L-arabinose transferase-like glycosyltransferase